MQHTVPHLRIRHCHSDVRQTGPRFVIRNTIIVGQLQALLVLSREFNGDHCWGLYRGYYRDPFPHSLLSTRQLLLTCRDARTCKDQSRLPALLLCGPVMTFDSLSLSLSLYLSCSVYTYIHTYVRTYIHTYFLFLALTKRLHAPRRPRCNSLRLRARSQSLSWTKASRSRRCT